MKISNNTEQGTPNDDLQSMLHSEKLKTKQYDEQRGICQNQKI